MRFSTCKAASVRGCKARVTGASPRRPVRHRAHPLPSVPLPVHEGSHITGDFAFQYVIHGPRQFGREHGQGRACAMLLFQAGQGLVAWRMVAQQQDNRCGKGPLEIGVTDILARDPRAFARRCLGTLRQAAIRPNILHVGEGRAFPRA
jgi:hypothetical protein